MIAVAAAPDLRSYAGYESFCHFVGYISDEAVAVATDIYQSPGFPFFLKLVAG